MPADKQPGLLQDILDSAKAIRQYMTGVTRDQFMADSEKQDAVLRRLRQPGESGYQIPRGGLYRFISCPNYFEFGNTTCQLSDTFLQINLVKVRL